MPPGSLADADAAAVVSNYLADHPDVQAELARYPPPPGVTDGLGNTRVLAVVRPPYPMLRVVRTPGGSDNDLRWRLSPEVLIEAWGDESGWPGPAALRRLLYVALTALKALPDQPVTDPTQPVVTKVMSITPAQPLPDPTGQERWLSAVEVTIHPGLQAPPLPPAPSTAG